MKTTIKTLYQKGYNKTQIGQMLDIDRKTVRKVLKEDDTPTAPEQIKAVWPSMLDEYWEYIQIQLAKELSITRIHHNLMKEFGGGMRLHHPAGLCGKNTKEPAPRIHGAAFPARGRGTGGFRIYRDIESKRCSV